MLLLLLSAHLMYKAAADQHRPAGLLHSAGLHTVKLQQLHPEASVPVLKALAALQHLRTLDLP